MPVRLHEKILECEEPVVGLDFVTELLPESDPEVYFLYVCAVRILFVGTLFLTPSEITQVVNVLHQG